MRYTSQNENLVHTQNISKCEGYFFLKIENKNLSVIFLKEYVKSEDYP